MKADFAVTQNSVERIGVSGRRDRAGRLIPALIASGIMASFAAFLSMQQATLTQATPDQLLAATVAKSRLYYLSHAAEVILLVSAGLIALLSTDFRTIKRGYLLRFLLLIGAALLMTRTYSLSDLLSTKLVDWTGPVPFLLSALVFVGSRRGNWTFLSKFVVITAVLLSGLALLGMSGLQGFTRNEGVARLGGTLNDLYWPASWMALTEYPQTSVFRPFRFGPIVIYAVGSLFTQTRLNFVMIFALIGVYVYLQHKRRIPQAIGWIAALTGLVWVGLFTATFLRNSRSFETLDSVVAAFSSRLDEDTRTGQLVSFAQDVKSEELLLGRGSFASWYWGGDYWGGTDVGYLTLLLYGGVPLLLTYVATHLTPCLGILRKDAANWRLTAAGVVFLWGIRLFSSDYPSIVIGYYFVLFCVGACISRDLPSKITLPSLALH